MALPPINLVPLTELDSVNNLLMSIGQSPVNSLTVPGVKDVSIAQLTLHNISREVQSKGWWFNTDDAWPFVPDVTGEIAIPQNALQVHPQDASVVERNRKFYDKTKRSYTFEQGKEVPADVTWFFAFESLPQIARNYIERRAGRVFQTNIVASQILYQFTLAMENESFAEMDRANLRGKKLNWFQSASSSNQIVNRR